MRQRKVAMLFRPAWGMQRSYVMELLGRSSRDADHCG
jgi:hypothetical protein